MDIAATGNDSIHSQNFPLRFSKSSEEFAGLCASGLPERIEQ